MRRSTLVFVLLFSQSAWGAGPYDLDIQRFRPAVDSRGFVTVERSDILASLDPSLGLYSNYALRPLTQKIGDERVPLVRHVTTGNFFFSLGLFDFMELGATLPVVIIRADPDGPDGEDPLVKGDGIGDLGAHLKVRVLDRRKTGIGIGLLSRFEFGTGTENGLVSHGQGLVVAPRLMVDWKMGQRFSMAVNGGARLRETRRLDQEVTPGPDGPPGALARVDPVVLGSEATWGVGLGAQLIPERLEFLLEGFGGLPLIDEAARAITAEVLAALRIFVSGNSFFTVGASRGLAGGAGDPELRIFAGIVFEPTVGDRDKDGILDDVDRCQLKPEDFDGYEDTDGCPELDNDMDGLVDLADQCPDDPEDKNGFEDRDGCPDGERDRDQDGFTDRNDECPDDPEDKDGFQDDDGCPEEDNDEDGYADAKDGCPDKAEDFDGFEDDDGCPDTDNDQDGILDQVDRCPDQAENPDGVDDEDGCPEARVVLTREKIEIAEKVYFQFDQAVIKSASHSLLDEVAQTLKGYPQIKKLEVQGHSDSRGSDDYNLDLSDRRAAAVRAYLIEKGIDSERLVSRGYGETQPLVDEENEKAWANNRRVAFIIIEHSGSKRPNPM